MNHSTNPTKIVQSYLQVAKKGGTIPQEFIDALNRDLSLEYAASIQYVVHAANFTDPSDVSFAKELNKHADEESSHAKLLADRINFLGGLVTIEVGDRNTASDTKTMIQQDLDGEQTSIDRYKTRISEAEKFGDIGTAQTLRAILADEEEHKSDLLAYLKK
jgi:bacterioferritin